MQTVVAVHRPATAQLSLGLDGRGRPSPHDRWSRRFRNHMLWYFHPRDNLAPVPSAIAVLAWLMPGLPTGYKAVPACAAAAKPEARATPADIPVRPLLQKLTGAPREPACEKRSPVRVVAAGRLPAPGAHQWQSPAEQPTRAGCVLPNDSTFPETALLFVAALQRSDLRTTHLETNFPGVRILRPQQ